MQAVAGSASGTQEKETLDQAEATGTDANYFEAFRQERSETRELEIGYLDEVIATSASDAETLADAQEQSSPWWKTWKKNSPWRV